MGTNYYWKHKICRCCNKPEREIHIGKKSSGWQFIFAADKEYGLVTSDKWMMFLEANKADGEVTDEYGQVISLEEFRKIVAMNNTDMSHHRHRQENYPKEITWNHTWNHIGIDEKGYSVIHGTFS